MPTRIFLSLLLLLWNSAPFCQTVTNAEPLVAQKEKWLYDCFDNPISITAGDKKNLKISVTNGTLKKIDEAGNYTLRPDSTKYQTTIVMSTKGYSKEFVFLIKDLPIPTFGFIGWHHNANPRSVRGIYAYIPNFEHDVPFRIDSFLVTRSDMPDTQHVNIGQLWDDVVENWIRTAKKGTTFTVKRVHVTCGGSRGNLKEEQLLYIAYD